MPVAGKPVQFVKPFFAGSQGTPVPGQSVLEVRGTEPVHQGFQCGKSLLGFRHRSSAAGEDALCPGGMPLPCISPQSSSSLSLPAILLPHPKTVGFGGAGVAASYPVIYQSAQLYTGIASALFAF